MFKKMTPEELAQREAERLETQNRKEQGRLEAEHRRKAEAFAKTPRGRARAALYEGASLFQITLNVTEVVGSTIDPFLLYKGQSSRVTTKTNTTVLESIEAEGWTLENAGYVYMITKTESSAKLMTSGQREAVSGTLVGIYIFRRKPD